MMTRPGAGDAGRPLRVLLVHNRYQQRGGEDAVVDAEQALLLQHGHAVERYERHNDDIASMPAHRALLDSWWSRRSPRDLAAIATRFKPDVVHVHNSFPLISPSVLAAARALQLPVVQTLHNFRLLCPQGSLLRRGHGCDDCVGHAPWRAVRHACYRGSVMQSAAVAVMLQGHRWRGTWHHDVTLYLALNRFCADTFTRGGLPANKLRIKPNFVDLPELPAPPPLRSGLLFVGRLSAEKGTALLAAATALRPGAPPVKVIGDGPERAQLEGHPGLQLMGSLPPHQVLLHMQAAAALVLPSVCAEAFPRTLVEAFACGLPVIASRVGALPELVQHGRTGWLFDPQHAHELASWMQAAEAQTQVVRSMGDQARAHHQAHWTGDLNHRLLSDCYREAMHLHAAR
jgi:glycosyltransferase involved in cell wall biosynthesis